MREATDGELTEEESPAPMAASKPVSPLPMRLYLCDMALERVRLVFARRETFAPLNGLLANSTKPVASDAAELAGLMEEARANLARACKVITELLF